MEFETDCKQVVDRINREEDDVVITTIASDIKKLNYNFDKKKLSFARRMNNSVNHRIAKFAAN